jgi:U3 small nucleolar RNA-associated protein 13
VVTTEVTEPAPAGSELTEVLLLPGGKGLVATTGDARLLFLQPIDDDGAEAGASLEVTRQLIGNHDEVTDVRFLGPAEAPTHLALSTNSHEFRLYDLATLSCTASCIGHRDAVLCLDVATSSKGRGGGRLMFRIANA